MKPTITLQHRVPVILCSVLILLLTASSTPAEPVTYGVRDDQGNLVPKVNVEIKGKEILISKVSPDEEFRSISFAVNQSNLALKRNIGLLKIQWISTAGVPGREWIFTGSKYNQVRKVFRDSMTKSRAAKIIDKTNKDLFAGKHMDDLFSIRIEGRPTFVMGTGEGAPEDSAEAPLGENALKIDKTSIEFTPANQKTGETIDVRNISGRPIEVGIDFPQTGLYTKYVRRKPDQAKVEPQNFGRFPLEPGQGFFVVLIPERDPSQVAGLNNEAILITIWDGPHVAAQIPIQLEVSPELMSSAAAPSPDNNDALIDRPEVEIPPVTPGPTVRETTTENSVEPAPPRPETPEQSAVPEARSSELILWAAVAVCLVIALALGGVILFLLIPRLQVLEDRLEKSEMFLHGTREAIREELEDVKEDIIRQCLHVQQDE